MGAESRSSPRFAVEASVEVRGPDATARGRTSNLSRGGFAAIVDTELGRGQMVEVLISLVFDEDTFSEPLALPARVVWATAFDPGHFQLGAQFVGLTDNQSHYLEMFLRYLADDDDEVDEPDDDDPFAS